MWRRWRPWRSLERRPGWSSPRPRRSSPPSPPTPSLPGSTRSSPSPAPTTSRRQIRQGVTPDVYAAANTSLPDDLFEEGLVSEPVVFATNTLVLAVPAGSPIASLDDITADGVTLAIGDEGVPVGDYTREVLGGLPKAESDAILANVRSLEPDVAGIVGKLTQGAVDAGFVYVTDVTATDGAITAIDLPGEAGSRRSPTEPRSSKGPRTPTGRSRSSTACSKATARTRCARPASARPRVEKQGALRPCDHRRAGGDAALPALADRRDLRRHASRRAARKPRQRRLARRALAQHSRDPDRARRDCRRRHPRRVPAGDPRVSRQGAGHDPDRAPARRSRRPSPGSGYSPPSARAGSSARRSRTPGSSSRCRRPA